MMNKLAVKFTRIVETSRSQLDRFEESFAKDPAYAFSWGEKAFQAAARIKVASMIVDAVNREDTTVEGLKRYLMDGVMHRAKYPAQSTSPTSNLMEQYEMAAYAEALSMLQYD
jgi:hypothetical protein